MRFGEIERSTTNPFLSLLRSLPEEFPFQTQKYESDVPSHNERWLRIKTEMPSGSSRNRGSIGHANGVGINGEINVRFKRSAGKRDR
jgi:hypothetical protein